MKTKKELKEEYKQKKFKPGVYRIVNKVNGKIFIGSSVNLEAALRSQKFQLETGGHMNNGLQKDWNQMGEENFLFEIIDEVNPDDDKIVDLSKEVKALEEIHIDEIQPFEAKGYNKRKAGNR